MNVPPLVEEQSLSEPITTVRPAHLGRNAGVVSLQSGYALPTRHHPRGLILIDARLSPCLSRCSVARERGYPDILVVDNGPELRGRALDGWADDHGVQLYFIDPGKPTQNAYIESFNGRYREECLNQHWFGEAREIIEDWRIDYNTERPHSSLKYQTPEEFAAARPFDKTQWAQPLELRDGSAPAPIAHAAE